MNILKQNFVSVAAFNKNITHALLINRKKNIFATDKVNLMIYLGQIGPSIFESKTRTLSVCEPKFIHEISFKT